MSRDKTGEGSISILTLAVLPQRGIELANFEDSESLNPDITYSTSTSPRVQRWMVSNFIHVYPKKRATRCVAKIPVSRIK